MYTIDLGKSGLLASAISLGCLRMDALSTSEAANVLRVAYENGINFFDHSDFYGEDGMSEKTFAAGLKEAAINREDIFIQSKCGICDLFYDFSKSHILQSVDGILKRLNTDYLDVLLLHRPDALIEPEEVAEAFRALRENGKVRYFGVSNQHPMQIELLQKYMDQKLIINQLQFSPVHTGMIDAGIQVNMKTPGSLHHDGMVLEYCRLKDIAIQAWSPFQYGHCEGVYLTDYRYETLNKHLRQLADQKGTTPTAIVIAWILRHPAGMQVIIGSMNPKRILEVCNGVDIQLSREEWYGIYRAAGNLVVM